MEAPLCRKDPAHGPKVWHKNRAHRAGGRWACRECNRLIAERKARARGVPPRRSGETCIHGHGPKEWRDFPSGGQWYCRECARINGEKHRRAEGVQPARRLGENPECIHGHGPMHKMPSGFQCVTCRRESANRGNRARGAAERGSPEHLKKLSEARKGRRQSPETRAKQGASRTGAKNHKWKGDDAGYAAAHSWLNYNYPRTGICEACGDEPDGRGTDYAFLGEPGGYERNRSMYREMCKSCHVKMDNWLRRLLDFGIKFIRS